MLNSSSAHAIYYCVFHTTKTFIFILDLPLGYIARCIFFFLHTLASLGLVLSLMSLFSIVYKQRLTLSLTSANPGKRLEFLGRDKVQESVLSLHKPTNAKGMEGQQAHKGGAQYVPAEKRKRDGAEAARGRGGRGGQQQPRGGASRQKKKGSYDTGSSGRLPEGPQVERLSEYSFSFIHIHLTIIVKICMKYQIRHRLC